MYIKAIKIYLVKLEKFVELTTWNPVVEKAEKTEKIMLLSPNLESLSQIKKMAKKIMLKEMKKRAIALYVVDLLILWFKIVFSSLFFITQKTVEIKINIVEILIPPDVPVGFAPINIKTDKKSFVKLLILEKSTLTKPQVLAEVELKIELAIFFKKPKSFKTPLNSKIKKINPPKTTRKKEAKIAIFELIERRFSFILAFFKEIISLIVTNPIPPMKVKAFTVNKTK